MLTFAARSVTARNPRRWRSAAVIGAMLAIGALGLAAGASAAPGKSLHAKLLGVFAFGPCPADAPAGAACLHDEVGGALKDAGTVDGHFDVVIGRCARECRRGRADRQARELRRPRR